MVFLRLSTSRLGLATAILTSLFTLRTLHGRLEFKLSSPPSPGTLHSVDVDKNGFDWCRITATEKLIWYPCYPSSSRKIECSRLLVPLNHSEPYGEQASLALARIPSPLSGHKDYRGPILMNPGGPGGSGVDLVLHIGAAISAIVGPQFDVLGFDPRGVARSTPAVDFFQSHLERVLWDVNDRNHVRSLNVVNATADGLARSWARSKVQGRLAAGQRDVLRHINTDQTAHDMLKIVEAHGREKIQYWGYSYGTTLGATFASLYPDRVDRLVLDGVMDMERHFGEGTQIASLSDTDKNMDSFYTSCHAAGPQKCAFYDQSPDHIRQNLDSVYTAIKKRPLPTFFQGPDGRDTYGLVDYNLLRMSVFQALYSPFKHFRPLAEALADLHQAISESTTHPQLRRGEKIYQLFRQPRVSCSGCCTRDDARCRQGEEEKDGHSEILDACIAIVCNDSDQIPGDYDDLKSHFEAATNGSQWGEIWGGLRAMCVGWPDLPKTHFRGPIGARTSHPILLIGNTADTVTPLWAAKKTSRWFPKSVVLTQDSAGHGSFAAPSLCTQMHVRKYFVDGVLPEPGTVCSALGSPFDQRIAHDATAEVGGNDQELLSGQMNRDGVNELLNAVWDLSTSYSMPKFFL